MTDHWTVKLHQSHTNGSKNPKRRWVVDPPGYDHTNRTWGDHRWHVAGGKWFQWDEINITKREAWEQALAYADHKARTVEVTLPRNADINVEFDFWRAGRWDPHSRVTIIKRSEPLTWEEVALALLAHHYQNQTP